MHHRSLFAAALALALVFGCKKKESAPPPEVGSAAPAPAAPADVPLTAEFFGKAVAPPGALAALTTGQSEDAARKAAPALFEPGARMFHSSSATGVKDVLSYIIRVDARTVTQLTVELAGSAKPAELIAQAWGPGTDAIDETDAPRTCWFGATTGWRACLSVRMDDRRLDFDRYLPVAALLGDGPDTLGFAPQGILGATLADLRARFGGAVTGADPDVRLKLPPTEWGPFGTDVELTWMDGAVATVRISLPYWMAPGAKAEIKALFDKKWGPPKEGSDALRYRDKAPAVFVTDTGRAWTLTISSIPLG